ncbi:MAG: M3 family metallopeptidase [Bdellovibrionales bacterium]|nr:M3 family metallopeptidase [Bdellovibrionales bacterium]
METLFSLKNNSPFSAIPFDKIQLQDFSEWIKTGIAEVQKRMDAIASNPEKPTFKNTIEAMEFSGLELDRATTCFFNLLHACSDPALDAQSNEISARLAEHGNNILLNDKIFARVKAVHDANEELTVEQRSLLDKYYQDFTRNGALLSTEDKARLRELDKELAQMTPQFGQNVLKATNAFKLIITDEKDLAGLPDSAKQAAKETAEEAGQKNAWIFSLQAPSYVPFMTYCDRRELRQQMWIAYNQRSYLPGENSNRELCERIVLQRARRAELLGFGSHADFVLSRRMAKSPQAVTQFLKDLVNPSMAAARKEMETLKDFHKKMGGDGNIMPWDFAYLSEKLKTSLYDFNEEDLRPYFSLEATIHGIFTHAKKLFNLDFKALTNLPVYHPDVTVYEVSDQNGFVGLLYFDVFPRANKRGGAWMTTFLDQGSDGKQKYRPHVSIVCNFTKPTKDAPSLLTLNEVQTLFHEFGHALHALLSDGHYPSISGTNVLWDFVELPSQIMENWALEKETLDSFAKHYKTGELLPSDLYEKMKASRNFNAGTGSLRQVGFSLVDLAWHSTPSGQVPKVDVIEDEILKPMSLLPRIPDTNFSVTFSHIFAGGYSAGYYSYKWAEVLDADAFEYFKEKGIYSKEVADLFKKHILSQGGKEDPAVLYKRFRGREPDPKSLLRRSGLL